MKALKVIGIILATIFVISIIFFAATPTGRTVWNNYTHSLNKADEVSYETRKKVEDTARAYVSSYKSDVDIYLTYCDSEDKNKQEYAEAARLRAISTANSYNEYLQKNSYVWKDNMPSDLPFTLETDISKK